jgi:hypothetical protein
LGCALSTEKYGIYTGFLGRWFKEELCEINLLIGSQFQRSLPFKPCLVVISTEYCDEFAMRVLIL